MRRLRRADVHWETDWGQRWIRPSLDRRLAEHPDVELVFTTLSETSTGVVNDVRELADVATATAR